MIRAEPTRTGRGPVVNTMRGEFEAAVAGEFFRFDTRLSTVAAIEAACGDRAIVDVLNGIIAGRRARDQIPLIEAALAAADPACENVAALAGRATVGEAEAFILALIFALGFTVGAKGEAAGGPAPLDARSNGASGAASRSAC